MLDVLQMHGNMINYYRFKTIYIYIHETTYVSTNIDIRYWHCIDMCISKINPSIYISILSIYPLWPSIGWLNKNTNHQQFYLDNQLRAKYIYIYMVHRMADSEISQNIIFPNQVYVGFMFHSTFMVFGRRFFALKNILTILEIQKKIS